MSRGGEGAVAVQWGWGGRHLKAQPDHVFESPRLAGWYVGLAGAGGRRGAVSWSTAPGLSVAWGSLSAAAGPL